MLIASLVLSGILLVVSNTIIWCAKKPRPVYLFAWLALPPGLLLLVFPAYLLHALLTALVATGCSLANARPWVFSSLSLVAFVASYAYVGTGVKRDLDDLARRYPMESMTDRLAYEAARPSAAGPVTVAADDGDDDRGSVWQANMRSQVLRQLHEDSVSAFIANSGFGVGRMYDPMRVLHYDDSPGERDTLPAPPAPGFGPPPSSEGLDPLEVSTDSHPAGVDVRDVHRNSLRDFLDPRWFGYARDRDHVAGFRPHRVSNYPLVDSFSGRTTYRWRVYGLELVSLLKHAEPQVYLSDRLPRMEDLRDAPTRELDEFEQEQLPRLRAGESVVAATAANRVRMLGAIRARAECLNCHQATQGELLGAFSYDLRRDLPLPR